ncbi:MAG TPA: hypothetical protein VHS52_03155 [Acidimicrobiales bacterium]|jgi:cell division protein FtsL|nr:hypothetical protein [Acidimicrobiales bacterium]
MSQVRSARPAPRGATSEAAAAAAAPALRLVDRSALPRRRALTRVATVLAATLAGVGLFGVVALNVLLAQGQAGLDTLHSRADAAAARNGRLTVDVAQLESPERVVARARLLGMVPLAAVVYVPAADPASPLPPVPDGPVPAAAKAAAGPTATPTTPTTAATSTAASARTTPTTPTTTHKP